MSAIRGNEDSTAFITKSRLVLSIVIYILNSSRFDYCMELPLKMIWKLWLVQKSTMRVLQGIYLTSSERDGFEDKTMLISLRLASSYATVCLAPGQNTPFDLDF